MRALLPYLALGRYAELSVAGGTFATLLAHRQEEI